LSNRFLTKPNYIRIYGHRGARGEYPENTIEGFKHTFSLQINAIEFDVLISKDSVPTIYYRLMILKFMKRHLRRLKLTMLEGLILIANMEELFQNKKH